MLAYTINTGAGRKYVHSLVKFTCEEKPNIPSSQRLTFEINQINVQLLVLPVVAPTANECDTSHLKGMVCMCCHATSIGVTYWIYCSGILSWPISNMHVILNYEHI